jgi:hypothetical protein
VGQLTISIGTHCTALSGVDMADEMRRGEPRSGLPSNERFYHCVLGPRANSEGLHGRGLIEHGLGSGLGSDCARRRTGCRRTEGC